MFSISPIFSSTRRVLTRSRADARNSPLSSSALLPMRCKYCGNSRPLLVKLCDISSIMESISRSANTLGTSTDVCATTLATTSFSSRVFAFFSAACVSRLQRSAVNSAKVSKSEISFAKSSSSAGNSLRLISCSFMAKVASFPARCSAR